MARKKKKIDWKFVQQMLYSGCKGTEIAPRLGMHYETLYGRCKLDQKMSWEDYREMYRDVGNSMLREAQFELACAGNADMLKWLGKNRLGQRDKKVLEHEGINFSDMSTKELNDARAKFIKSDTASTD